MPKQRPVEEAAFELLEYAMQVTNFALAYKHGYRGFIPRNAMLEIDRLVKTAFALRKQFKGLRPKGFEEYF